MLAALRVVCLRCVLCVYYAYFIRLLNNLSYNFFNLVSLNSFNDVVGCHPNRIGELPARNKRSVWSVPTRGFKGAHFATFPPDLIRPCIAAGSPSDGIVLDPFMGAGTTAVVARELGRNYIGIELNEEYVRLAGERLG